LRKKDSPSAEVQHRNQENYSMITTEDKPKYAIVTFLQDAIAGALAGKIALVNFHAAGGTSLSHELRTGQSLPRNLALDFSPLLDLLYLPRLGASRPETILEVLADPFGELKRIFASDDPTMIFARLMDFFNHKPELASLASTLGSFLEGQFGIALSMVTTFKNLADPKFPRAVADASLQYFFGKDGFVTVDEIHVTPPMQFGGAPQQLSDLSSFLSQKTGERYLRDIIAITVEAVGDVQYNLRDRYPRMLSQLTDSAQQETAKRWFTGFASMAEAGVTTAVEETLLGIGTFQGNRLIAASAAAYAGTAARKATQHVFLSEMGA
jgi:hypothetical protein